MNLERKGQVLVSIFPQSLLPLKLKLITSDSAVCCEKNLCYQCLQLVASWFLCIDVCFIFKGLEIVERPPMDNFLLGVRLVCNK